MKYCITFAIACMLAIGSLQAQDRSLTRFYYAHRQDAMTFKIGIGSIPLHFASWMVPKNVKADNGMELKKLLSKIHHIKIYTIEGHGGAAVDTREIQELKDRLIRKDHFEALMEVRDEGSIVHILNKGKGDELGNMVMLVQDENDFVIVHLKTSLHMSDINSVIHEFAKN